jgi:hypothetical protein
MWATILAVATGITAVSMAIAHIIKIIHGIGEAAKTPWERVHKRLDALENMDKEILRKIANLDEKQTQNDQVTARLELLNLIQHCPDNAMAINRAYDQYIDNGWNSYIRDIVDDWKKEIRE